jgi:acyl-CoA thioesterase-1
MGECVGKSKRDWRLRRGVLAAALATVLASFGGHCSPSLAAVPAQAQARPVQPVLLVVGDSLSAEYGLAQGSGWVALLEQRIAAEHLNLRVQNASISGDTTAGGRSRLPALLAQYKPAVVVIELGGNDALRGLPIQATRDNLARMTQAAQQAGAQVLLLGMQVPPNYGRQYTQDFSQVFADVARSHRAALVPFLLKGVADGPDAATLFQPDRIHPLALAHPRLLANVWPVLRPLIGR